MDLDDDGSRDLISGSWPGEIFFFAGRPDGDFEPPEMLQDAQGEYINIGGGIKDDGSRILITGHGEFVSKNGGMAVRYHGEELVAPPGRSFAITGTASAVHAVDWDDDADLDLLVGDIHGSVWLVPNEGTAKEWAFGKERAVLADGTAIHVAGDAGPWCADWDGDGDFDLLVGDGSGSVSLFRNDGARGSPRLAAASTLVAPGTSSHGAGAPSDPTRGTRAKICTADWNGDGRLDLLLGDFATQSAPAGAADARTAAMHGWVWLFLRAPATSTAGAAAGG